MILQYDTAANRFYSAKTIPSLPIASWDIFGAHFKNVCACLSETDVLDELAKAQQWNTTVDFSEELLVKEHVIVITDASLKIVYASPNMHKMNGYQPNEVIGNSPKMFQGAATNFETSQLIKEAIQERRVFETELVNYRKDGTAYTCWIKGAPIFNKKGKVVNFIAFEREVA